MPAHSIRTSFAVAALTAIGIITGAAAATSAVADTTTTPSTATAPTWLSGVASPDMSSFTSWLGRDVDLDSTWAAGDTWQDMTNVSWLPNTTQFAGQLSIGLTMLPMASDSNATLSDCAAGDYDTYYSQVGSGLDAIGRGNSFIRLGWEFNGDWYPWSIANAKPAVWTSCWDNEVTALRSTDPAAQIVWNGNAGSSSDVQGKAASYYPGNAYVDVIGVDYYDAWPALDTASAWNAKFNETESDGMPVGLGAWLSFAEAHGKQLAVPEWGTVSSGATGGGGDDPYYVTAMHNFFEMNAANIAYEAYFDNGTGTAISAYSNTVVPHAAATYRELWDGQGSQTVSAPVTTTTAPVTTPIGSHHIDRTHRHDGGRLVGLARKGLSHSRHFRSERVARRHLAAIGKRSHPHFERTSGHRLHRRVTH